MKKSGHTFFLLYTPQKSNMAILGIHVRFQRGKYPGSPPDRNSKIILRINVKDFLPTRGAKFGSFDCKGLAGWPLHWKFGVERLNNCE